MNINTTYFSWLNSACSLLSIVVAPLAGHLMDNYSTAVGLYIGVLAILLSQMLATAAISSHSYPIMLISKLIYGIGFEPMNVGKKIILSAWFFGAELSLANNLNLAISREITFLTSIVTPGITAGYGITQAFLFGTFVCIVSAFSAILIIKL